MPSVECITSLTPPAPLATATNVPVESKPSAKHKPSQFEAAGDVRTVQVIPSGEVITRLVPPSATATNNRSSGDHVTAVHGLFAGDVRCVHVAPSVEVRICRDRKSVV